MAGQQRGRERAASASTRVRSAAASVRAPPDGGERGGARTRRARAYDPAGYGPPHGLGRDPGPRRGGRPPGAAPPRGAPRCAGIPHELVFVDDGSTRPLGGADRGARGAPRTGIVLVQLSRNFGMEIAMSAGLDHARGDHVVLMHADLQDPPELIPEMLAKARARRRRRLRAPDRPRRELAQARARDRLLRADGAPGARALPGPGGRLPADVAARGRDAARRCPSAAASCAGWSPGSASSRCRSSTAAPGATPAAARPTARCSGSRSRRSRRSRTCRWRSRLLRDRSPRRCRAWPPSVILVLDDRRAG